MDSVKGIWTDFLVPLLVVIASTIMITFINGIPENLKSVILFLIFIIIIVYYIPKNTKFRSIPVRLSLLLLIIILELTIIISPVFVLDKSPETRPPQIRINYTLDTAHITENITGTAQNIPERCELWILVYPYATKTYYPQYGGASVQNGVWSVPIYIGINDSIGEKFDIIAVLADNNARAELTSFLENGKIKNDWTVGMKEIPDGATVYDRITVVRKYENTTVTRETQNSSTQTRISDLLQIINNISAILASTAVICGTYFAYRAKSIKK